MIYFVCLLYFICIESCYGKIDHYYKISMVSSDETPGNPALFVNPTSIVWDEDRQSLFFVDTTQQNVHRLDYGSGKIFTKNIGYGPVTLVSLVASSERLLVAVRSALYLLDWGVTGDAALRLLTALDLGLPDNVINGGGPDPDGRLWAGTRGPQMGDDMIPDKGSLYRVDQATLALPTVLLRPVSRSAGMAWAKNNSMIYYIDARTQKVDAFDYDPQKGFISGRRTIIDVTVYGYDDSYPEGMAIDRQGMLWVTLIPGGTVLHIDPDRRHVIFGYRLPVSRVTSLAWGGPRMDELFITTARELDGDGDKSEPFAGAIFTIRDTGSQGRPANRFQLDNPNLF